MFLYYNDGRGSRPKAATILRAVGEIFKEEQGNNHCYSESTVLPRKLASLSGKRAKIAEACVHPQGVNLRGDRVDLSLHARRGRMLAIR